LDAKNSLDNESKNKSAKKVFTRSPNVLVEMHSKTQWDKGINVKVFFQHRKKFGFVVIKGFEAVCVNIIE
jgi:hypothetical protein